jgi:putative peptidoglycan lipid II flippase
MVRNVISIVYREVRGLHEAAYVLAVFTLGSQLLALIRDRLLAHTFGAGIELDLYYTAFRIPDVLYVIFASTLSVYVLIPFVADRIKGNDSTEARQLLSEVFSLFLILYTALAAILALFAPYLVEHLFPGLESRGADLVLLMRILLLQPFFLGISSLFGVITQFGHRFVLYAVSPLLYNLGIIFGVLVLYPAIGIGGLGWGVVTGAILHLLVQLPFVRGSELAPRFTRDISRGDVREVLMTSLPRAFTLSLHQLVLLGLIGFASIMTIGSVSVFQFAFNLQSVPLAIIGVSYSVAAFPLLAQLHADGKFDVFTHHIITALRHIIFWSLPAIALLVVIRAQFVRVVLGSGAFNWDDTRLTAAVLSLLALSLVSQAIHLLLVRALYAVGNTRLPFYVTLLSSLLALIGAFAAYVVLTNYPALSDALASLMRLQGIDGIEVLALPLGYSFGLIVHSIVLLFLSESELRFRAREIAPLFLRAFAAALAAGSVAYLTLNLVVTGIETDTLLTIFLQGLLAGVAGVLGALGAYTLLRTPELHEIYRALHKRIFKTDVAPVQDEDHLAV